MKYKFPISLDYNPHFAHFDPRGQKVYFLYLFLKFSFLDGSSEPNHEFLSFLVVGSKGAETENVAFTCDHAATKRAVLKGAKKRDGTGDRKYKTVRDRENAVTDSGSVSQLTFLHGFGFSAALTVSRTVKLIEWAVCRDKTRQLTKQRSGLKLGYTSQKPLLEFKKTL